MTRETKIGLLVGLTFIIVVGVLVSDYITSTREPQPAPLQMAGSDLRNGLGQPRSEEATPVAIAPKNVTPRQAVPTREELTPKPTPKPAEVAVTPTPTGGATLNKVAQRHGEELVDLNGKPIANNDVTPPAVKTVPTSYTAEPGDSLSRIAAKTLGANTKANRAAIIAMNPSLKDNPNMIVVGHEYAIPTSSGATTVAPVVVNTPTNAAKTGYIVKSGDTLWSIAVDQLGDANEVSAIKDLNRDVLGDSDRLRPNMKLRLPAKAAVASNT